jgi:endonuclease-3
MPNNNYKILKILKREYPKAMLALNFGNPIEILVSTILSAQCTDARVNMVTDSLFKKYKTVKDYANADPKQFEKEVHSTGFYRNKAKNIIAAAKKIISDFSGKVPDSMDELLELPGVARKTANIVLTDGFGKVEGIAVDTHVRRLSQRLGLSKNDDPNKIEQDLMKSFDKKDWGLINHLLVDHGRAICDARKPKCLECVLGKLCPSKKIFYPE